MKRISILLSCLFVFILTSCQFSEDIYINEDGSGKMSLSFDGSQLMEMAGEEMSKSQEKPIDSIISFKEFLDTKSDSISKLPIEDQEKLKSLEPFKMHMVMNPETSEMKFDMFREFEKTEDLEDMFKAMNNISNMQGKGPAKANDSNNPFSSLGKNGSTELSYAYNGKVFKRTATVIDKEMLKQMNDSLSDMRMMFASSKYKLNYHFPKPIKSVSNEEAMFSEDRKSVTVEFGFMDYITDPESLNLEVILED